MLSVDAMQELLEDGHRTLSRLPKAHRRGSLTYWPQILQDRKTGYGWEDVMVKLGPPSGERIDVLDRLLECSLTLSKEGRKAIWTRAARVGYRKLAAILGVPPRDARRVHRDALLSMCVEWERRRKNPRITS